MPTGIYKRKSKTVLERFEKYVDKSSVCWEWQGKISTFGYGQFSITWGDCWQAHRLAFKLYKGIDPKNLCVCHTCDNRSCVNPKHLWLGTQQENIKDMIKKGRAIKATSENNGGAKLTWKKVNEIRELYKTGKYFYKDLGKKFNVSKSTIKRIINKWSWKV